MEFKSKYDLGQRLYYINKKKSGVGKQFDGMLLFDEVEAILVELSLLGKVQYRYNFGRSDWYDEDEVCATEEEAERKFIVGEEGKWKLKTSLK